MATGSSQNDKQLARQMSAFLKKMMGRASTSTSGSSRSRSSSLRSASIGTRATTETQPHTMPRQLSATRYTANASAGRLTASGWSALLAPISSIGSLFTGLFGSSTREVTRYRRTARTPFHQVEAISPETRTAATPINESASGLFGVNASTTATSASASQTLMRDRQALTDALRRSLRESRGITDVLNEFQDGL